MGAAFVRLLWNVVKEWVIEGDTKQQQEEEVGPEEKKKSWHGEDVEVYSDS